MPTETTPYGLWQSPITPASMAQRIALRDLWWDSADERLLWLEGRSDRGVLVCDVPGGDAPRDLTSDLSVRAGVGYGGGDAGAWGGRAFFVAGGRLYRQPLDCGPAAPITPAYGDSAAPTVSPDGNWLLFVHSYEGRDALAAVDAEGRQWPRIVAQGADFYMQPAWSPDSRRIAWVEWDHPEMPWDGSRLMLGTLAQGSCAVSTEEQRQVAGACDVSVLQPSFSPDGRWLAYVSDVNGWYGLYLMDLESGEHRPLVSGAFEVGEPAWAQGLRVYAWAPDGRTVYHTRHELGQARLWSVDVASEVASPVEAVAGYAVVSQVAVSPSGRLAALVSGPRIPQRLVSWAPGDAGARIVARSEGETVPGRLLRDAKAVTWESGGETVHGLLYYPDKQRAGCEGLPPLIVSVHGGPTGQSTARYAPAAQFLATRGWAVLEVNYRGSAGYGRAYRNRLRGNWGLCDVEDAVSGAHDLAQRGLVDRDRMVIMGGSAGGYTVLRALIEAPGVFRAGVCLYGVTNLFTLASDTHKFEQHYLDSMIGPLPSEAQRYRERSPIFYADRIQDPVAIFQGDQDRVVPKEQAEEIVAVLRRRGVPHEYHLYAGEGHGWRRSETIRTHWGAVLRFLKQYVLYA